MIESNKANLNIRKQYQRRTRILLINTLSLSLDIYMSIYIYKLGSPNIDRRSKELHNIYK